MQGTDGASMVVSLLDAYDLTREDWDSIVELAHYKGRPEVPSLIPAKVSLDLAASALLCQHRCIDLAVSTLLCRPCCVDLAALTLLRQPRCVSLAVLTLLRWPHCIGLTALTLLRRGWEWLRACDHMRCSTAGLLGHVD